MSRLRMVEILEHLGTPQARKRLEQVSTGAEGARLTRDAKAVLARLQKTSK